MEVAAQASTGGANTRALKDEVGVDRLAHRFEAWLEETRKRVSTEVIEMQRSLVETQRATAEALDSQRRLIETQKDNGGGVHGEVKCAHKVHKVELGDCRFDPMSWKTVCGWSFGLAPHSRVSVTRVNCGRCIAIAHSRLGGSHRLDESS